HFANDLFIPETNQSALLAGYLPQDILRTVERAAGQRCFVCSESRAAVTCQEPGCDRSFHLPCAMEGGCINQYLPEYRSFCWEHRPEQLARVAPEKNTTCVICLDPVEDTMSYMTMVCPACKHAWFHRGCIQGQAVWDDIYSFCCPLCRDEESFLAEMLVMGIRVPLRRPSAESSKDIEALIARHSCCDASECLCPGGREQVAEHGRWELLLCSSCAAEGTHRRCSFLRNTTTHWECDGCAGLGTASSASSEITGARTDSQAGLGPSHGSPAPETGTESQEGSSRSSPPGPDRLRERTRRRRQAQTPYTRRRRGRESSRVPAPSAESSTSSQAALGPPNSSTVPETTNPRTESQEVSGQSDITT
ncbi:PHD finger protein 7-like, partial [Cuculus canorus]|uniref:PHD finger protein 7-like n=1 Tax=Cuculus canorus TaxID=55661 RepID=UPI0023AA2987